MISLVLNFLFVREGLAYSDSLSKLKTCHCNHNSNREVHNSESRINDCAHAKGNTPHICTCKIPKSKKTALVDFKNPIIINTNLSFDHFFVVLTKLIHLPLLPFSEEWKILPFIPPRFAWEFTPLNFNTIFKLFLKLSLSLCTCSNL